MGTPVLRVLTIAGDPLARSGPAHMLAHQSGLSVVGQTTMDADLSAEIGVTRPDVLLWDTGWDQAPALAVLQELLPSVQDAGPAMVALLAGARFARESWAAGVGGLIPRDVGERPLVAALSATAEGLAVSDPVMVRPARRRRQASPVP